MEPEKLASYIDHAFLNPLATTEQIKKLCDEAREYGFYSVCVNPRWVSFAGNELENSNVRICSVISFPFGSDTTEIKIAQANNAIFDGADEIDMVADLSAIAGVDTDYLLKQFQQILVVCRSMRPPVILKVIIESAALTDEQKKFACEICQRAGVDFVKTSTGFHQSGGATTEDIKLLRQFAPGCKTKASGGIKTLQQALDMIEAGADRLGTSSGVQLINELKSGFRP